MCCRSLVGSSLRFRKPARGSMVATGTSRRRGFNGPDALSTIVLSWSEMRLSMPVHVALLKVCPVPVEALTSSQPARMASVGFVPSCLWVAPALVLRPPSHPSYHALLHYLT